jgi:NADPH-dependent glutamate synthase beta subunit-like oxidoreductase
LKRFALDSTSSDLLASAKRPADSGKKIAVIGAGPAGLAAAFFLRMKGHGVTIFEAAKQPGGMAAQSIPGYRLPPAVLEKDIDVIRGLGVEIKTGHALATGKEMTSLLGDGFSAVLIAVGLPKSKKIAIKGNDLSNVHWGLEFLKAAKMGTAFDLGKKVVIVGGGNVAVDVAMTAQRISRADVSLFCLESREAMPAHAEEIAKAEAEGVKLQCGWGPTEILDATGKVSGVAFMRCVSVLNDKGRFAPTFDEAEKTTVDADSVILAIGQGPPEDVPAECEGVFLAGDIAGGGLSIVHAVASARSQAQQIDRFLGGDGTLLLEFGERKLPDAWIGREDAFAPRPRIAVPSIDPAQRRNDFREIDGTYSSKCALAEAKRCLQCDLRLLISEAPFPPEKWQAFDRPHVMDVPAAEGVFLLADASKKATLIKGATNMRSDLLDKLDGSSEARFFLWEEDRMYTKRESELIQQHLEQYGELPGGGDDELDDLF